MKKSERCTESCAGMGKYEWNNEKHSQSW